MKARKKHVLYRHFDEAGNLLYAGISLCAIRRSEQHEHAPWFDEIATISVKKYPDRDSALAAERKAIAKESPRYNIARTLPFPEPKVAHFGGAVTETQLLDKIARYCKRHHLTATEFGIQSVNNSALVTRLKQGKTITVVTLTRVLSYMAKAA